MKPIFAASILAFLSACGPSTFIVGGGDGGGGGYGPVSGVSDDPQSQSESGGPVSGVSDDPQSQSESGVE